MLSPQEAAGIAKVSRRTIMVAIQDKRLEASRNNRNHWQIARESLEGWMANREASTRANPVTTSETHSDTHHTQSITIARLEEQLKAAVQRADNLESSLKEAREAHRTEVAEMKAEHQKQMAQRDADYREAMDLLRATQRRRGLLEFLGWRKPHEN